MEFPGKDAGIRQFLLLFSVTFVSAIAAAQGQDQAANELALPVDEPQVIIPENSLRVPVRTASQEVETSSDPLVKLVWETREATRRRLLSTSEHTPWQMMHGLLGLRQDFLINHNGQTVSGLEWIQTGPTYQNESWFERTVHGGRAHPFNKPYWFEGHINQFLAILATCNVPLDTQFGTPQGPISMRDMLKNAQMTANEREEVTWTLWALCTYLPPDAEWINAKGERWSIERLVKIEIGKPVGGPTSPCGGTHGLFALARARNVYLRTGKPLQGTWLQAEQKIQKYIQTARMLQNTNGTLSSSYFKGREYKQDFDKRMASMGHVLEFLMMALPQDQLKDAWVRRAIESTAKDLMANRKAYVSCSPLYHATNAMSIYLDRVAPAPANLVQQPQNTRSISRPKELTSSDSPAASAPVKMATRPAGNTAAQQKPISSDKSASVDSTVVTGDTTNSAGTTEQSAAKTSPAGPKPEVGEPAASTSSSVVTSPPSEAGPGTLPDASPTLPSAATTPDPPKTPNADTSEGVKVPGTQTKTQPAATDASATPVPESAPAETGILPPMSPDTAAAPGTQEKREVELSSKGSRIVMSAERPNSIVTDLIVVAPMVVPTPLLVIPSASDGSADTTVADKDSSSDKSADSGRPDVAITIQSASQTHVADGEMRIASPRTATIVSKSTTVVPANPQPAAAQQSHESDEAGRVWRATPHHRRKPIFLPEL
jgi:hypothetical protein